MRCKTEERRNFTHNERKQIFDKSDYRCCRCGKKLDIYEQDSTIEHIIPISKGGHNDLSNLVVLCVKCNENKNNLVLPPHDYYYYLKEEYHQEVMTLYKNYCEDISYYDRNNFTKDDVKIFTYHNRIDSMNSFVPKSGKKNYHYGRIVPMQAVLRKAVYSDLDDIYEYCKKYHKKYGLPTDDLKDVMSHVFNKGAFYMIKKGQELISVIPVAPDVFRDRDNERQYIVFLSGVPSLYTKDIYIPLICDCIEYILGEISKIDSDGNVVFKMNVPQNDMFLHEIASRLRPHGRKTLDDEWCVYYFIHTYVQEIPNYQGDDDVLDIYRQLKDDAPLDKDKCIKRFSKSMQRVFKLKPLESHEKKERKAKTEFNVSPAEYRKKRRKRKHHNSPVCMDESLDVLLS